MDWVITHGRIWPLTMMSCRVGSRHDILVVHRGCNHAPFRLRRFPSGSASTAADTAATFALQRLGRTTATAAPRWMSKYISRRSHTSQETSSYPPATMSIPTASDTQSTTDSPCQWVRDQVFFVDVKPLFIRVSGLAFSSRCPLMKRS